MKIAERNLVAVCLALSLVTVVAYWGVHTHDFVNLDDPVYIERNQNIQNGFTAESLKWAFTASVAANWHPVTLVSHMLDCSLFGLNPGGPHVVNLVIHILNVLLLFSILKNATNAVWKSAFVACLFAIHPLHVESVAWVSERKDLLSTMFGMLAIIAYARYCRLPSVRGYAAVFVLLALGLMAKPMLVTLPFILLLMDYWPLERLRADARETNASSKSLKIGPQKYAISYLITEKIPLFALVAISSVITFVVQQKSGAVMDATGSFSLALRVANAFVSYAAYIQKMIWPSALAPFYPHPGDQISITFALVTAGLLLIVSILVIRFGKAYKYLPVGWFWYLGMLVPVIGLVQVGQQAYADRYTYLPLVGLFIIVAWFVPQLLSKWRFKTIVLAISWAVILPILTARTQMQQRYWNNSIKLFEHAIQVTTDNFHAHYCIAEPLRLKGRLQEAIDHNTVSLKIKPDNPGALNSLGLALIDSGRFEEAIACFEKAIKIRPDAMASYANMSIALSNKGDSDALIALYRRMLQKFNAPDIHLRLGEALRKKGDREGAIQEYTSFLAFEPANEIVHFAAGALLSEQGRDDEALIHFQKALKIKPGFGEAHNSLGKLLLRRGKYGEAIRYFQQALMINPDNAEARSNLQAARQRMQ